ncbi:MAG: glycosyltransferase family 2 protein [Clostridia bacterium]|nr:glycosyltransferase family 2 protein [Clostridia bacterium]
MESNSSIKVSVIVPLYNEERFVEGLIDSFKKQTFPIEQTEWILVDGKSTDRTVELIKQNQEGLPIVLLTNEMKKACYALNLAIDCAKGEIIIRMDAHASFPPDYIEKCVHYLDTMDIDNVGGVADTRAEGYVGGAISNMLSTKFGVGGSSFRVGEGNKYVDTVPFGAFKRSVFDKVGKFNVKLTRSEDNDLNARIREAGGKIWLAEDIRFNYYCRDTVGGLLKMGLQNGNALFRTIKENPKAMSIRHFIPFLFLMSLLVLTIGAIWLPFVRWVLVAEIGLYTLLNVYFSFFKCGVKNGFIAIWLYPLFHLTYGMGSLLGLFGVEFY